MRVSYRCKTATWVTVMPQNNGFAGWLRDILFIRRVSSFAMGEGERGTWKGAKNVGFEEPFPHCKKADTRHINKKAAYRTLSRRNNRVNHLAGKGGIGRGEARRIT